MKTEQQGSDLLQFEVNYVRAEQGKRFLNYIIDIIVFYLTLFFIGIIIGLLFPTAFYSLSTITADLGFADRILTLVCYGLYMSIIEAVFKGKSLGKLITKTPAVNLDGTPISTSTAFARSFSRAVPFCAFSAFGTPCDPWQDKWTDTMVIDEKKSGTDY